MRFTSIPYKEEEKHILLHQVSSNKIPHAQIFLGNEGSSNLALALAYIAFIMCENKESSDSCGTCPSCKLTYKYIHPDVHFSFPVVKIDDKKREDTTSDDFLPQWRSALEANPFMTISQWQSFINASTKPNINTKECGDIIHKLSYQSFGSGPKILLMWMPEYLGKEGNKLLKLIEEPTENTYIILVANDQNKILNTILSRCQLMKFLPYHKEDIEAYVMKEFGIAKDIATQYANLAEGNISTAISLAKEGEKNLSSMLFDWLRICYKGDALEIQNFTNEFTANVLDVQVQFMEYALHFFQNFYTFITIGHNSNFTQNELDVAGKMGNILTPNNVEEISKVLNQSILNILRNANAKLNITTNSIMIGDILKNRSTAFVDQINELELLA